jgi:hypothetical protein
MPLAAFMAFKKFVILFVLLLGLFFGVNSHFRPLHYWCIAGILGGGLLIGERDLIRGEFGGYFWSLVYTLLEAGSLQVSTALNLRGVSPRGTW